MSAPNPILARAWRGSAVESVHRGAVAVMRGGEIVFSLGDIDAPECLRSTAKPFQALTALEIILGAGFEMSDAEIAVVSSSHSGQPLHVGLVRALLDRAAIPESNLRCGPHAPMHAPSAAALLESGQEPSVLHNNCSGKHAAMLIATKLLGASVEDYLQPEHPIQTRNRATLARFAEVGPDEIGIAVDGCSAPTFILPLHRLARACSNLMTPADVDWNSDVWRRWMAAIAGEPLAYAGEGRPCTKLIELTKGQVYPKIGAEGVYVAGVPSVGLGIATKIDDGSHRATEALIATVLLHVGRFPPEIREVLHGFQDVPIKNHSGLLVGRLEVSLP